MNTYTVNVDVENNSNQPLEGVAIAVDNLTSTNTTITTSPSANTNTNTTTNTTSPSANTTTNTSTNTNNNTSTNQQVRITVIINGVQLQALYFLGIKLNVTATIGTYFSYTVSLPRDFWASNFFTFTCPQGLPDKLVITVQGNMYYEGTSVTLNSLYDMEACVINVMPTDVPLPIPQYSLTINNSGALEDTDNVAILLIPALPDGTVLNNAQLTVLKNYSLIAGDNDIPTISNTGESYVKIRQGEKYLFTAQLDGYTFDQLNLITADPHIYYIYGVQNPIQVNKGSIYPMMLMTLPNMHSNLNETYCEMYYKGATVSCNACDYAWHDYILYDSTCKPYTYIVPQSAVNSLLTQGTLTGPWNGLIPFGTPDWTPSQIGIVELAMGSDLNGKSVLIFKTSPLPEQIVAIYRLLYIPGYPECPIVPDSISLTNLFNGTSMSTIQPISTTYNGVGAQYWQPVSWAYIIKFSDNSLMGIGPFTSTTSLPSNLQYVYPLSAIPSCISGTTYNYNTPIPSWIYNG